jgi:hypothetical protein
LTETRPSAIALRVVVQDLRVLSRHWVPTVSSGLSRNLSFLPTQPLVGPLIRRPASEFRTAEARPSGVALARIRQTKRPNPGHPERT